MTFGWSRSARVILFTAAVGAPALIVTGAATGWSRSALGMPPWASWTLAVPALLVGLPLAWFSTSLGTRNATNILLRAYRRAGLREVERLCPSRIPPDRVGVQLFNLALALQREGNHSGAEDVYRRAAQLGFPPAMWNLGNILGRRGEEAEAQALHRRALAAGLDPETDL